MEYETIGGQVRASGTWKRCDGGRFGGSAPDRGLRRERDVGDEGDGADDGAGDARVCSDDEQGSSAANCAREDENGRDSELSHEIRTCKHTKATPERRADSKSEQKGAIDCWGAKTIHGGFYR
jgi:hypothetical protein